MKSATASEPFRQRLRLPSLPVLGEALRRLFPGIAISFLVAATAQFLYEHYGAPAMLMALLLGLSLNFLSDEGTRTAPGIEFTSRPVLRIGVALLGLRVSAEIAEQISLQLVALVIVAMLATILLGIVAARVLGKNAGFGFLTRGSVAICGASAAMAIASILPQHEKSDRDLLFTVLAVTLLSTIAMIAYPVLAEILNLGRLDSAVFIGGTIHDVAQVVGAGFSISQEAGETATVVKLIRVAMLAPVIVFASAVIRVSGMGMETRASVASAGVTRGRETNGRETRRARPPLLPLFLCGFLFLAVLNSFGLVPAWLSEAGGTASRWALLTAVSAVGLKTSLRRILEVGPRSITLVVLETVFLGAIVLAGLVFLV